MRVRVRGGLLIPELQPPREAHIELTTECNLNCLFCYRRNWYLKSGFMDTNTFKKILVDLKEVGVRSLWFDGFGEPTFHPEFEEFSRTASRDFEVNLVTNGTLLESKVKGIAGIFSNIFISIESLDPELHQWIRGSSLMRIGESIRELSKQGVRVWILSVLMKSTHRKLPSLVKWASELGVRGVVFSNLLPTSEEIEGERLYGTNEVDGISVLIREAWLVATANNMKLIAPSFHYRTDKWCPFVEGDSFAVTYDGEVAPCLFTLHSYNAWLDGKHVGVKQISFGNIREKGLKDIWFSESYVAFRSFVKLFQYPSCNDCPAWEGCQISESNEYDCWGNTPSCSFCPYYKGVIQCPNSALVRGLFS